MHKRLVRVVLKKLLKPVDLDRCYDCEEVGVVTEGAVDDGVIEYSLRDCWDGCVGEADIGKSLHGFVAVVPHETTQKPRLRCRFSCSAL